MSSRVVVIEDDPGIGPMLSNILKMEGFDVTVITDGTQAAARVRSGGYQAAVLDVMLPGKDGITILHELRDADETASLPVVMLSAKTDDATTWQGWRAGANYYMSKPFDPDELVRVLRSVLH